MWDCWHDICHLTTKKLENKDVNLWSAFLTSHMILFRGMHDGACFVNGGSLLKWLTSLNNYMMMLFHYKIFTTDVSLQDFINTFSTAAQDWGLCVSTDKIKEMIQSPSSHPTNESSVVSHPRKQSRSSFFLQISWQYIVKRFIFIIWNKCSHC